jgi:hypothetical protein
MAIRQGSIDCLCGMYSVLNATEIVIEKYKFDRSLPKKKNQKRALFNDLVGYLARQNMLKKALTVGIVEIDLRGGLIDIAIKSVKKYQGLKMKKQTAFDEDPDSLDAYWEKLTQHLMQENTSVIISISGRVDHWTCVKEITSDHLILADSNGMKHIQRHQCVLGAEEKGKYMLWPTMTYLLSLEKKKAIRS